MRSQFAAMRRGISCADRISAFGRLLVSTWTFAAIALLGISPGTAQPVTTPEQPATTPPTATGQGSSLPPIQVSGERPKRAKPKKPRTEAGAAPAPNPGPTPAGNFAGIPMTPLNAVAASASRLGLPVLQTPASVEIVTQQTMQDQGYRTSAEIANGAVGVLDLNSSGAPANFSMRGFTFGAVNVLYNGISIGVASDTTRVMDTANTDQVEFLKGPSALMSGIMAIGGSVNYVSKQPTTGPIQNEADFSLDSLGSVRSHYGSGGSTAVEGLDYRVDVTGSRIDGFVDGDYRYLGDFSAQLNYRVNNMFKTFVAIEYKQDAGQAYWGTPVVPISFAGSHAVSGVVSGNAFSTFSGSNLGPVTIDSQTLTTNYNVANNATSAQELWLRSGFEWTPLNNVTVKDQVYYYQNMSDIGLTARHTPLTMVAVFAPNVIDRDRFFVTHNQHVVGNNLDFLWDSRLFGMDNRLAAQLQVSTDWITFVEEGNPNDYPYDYVAVIDPVQGVYGPEFPDIRNKQLSDVALAVRRPSEDHARVRADRRRSRGRLDAVEQWRPTSMARFPAASRLLQVWKPVSYRAAVTYEPIHNLVFYGMYATSYDPAAADVFSVNTTVPLALTSAANLRDRRQTTVLGQQGRMDFRRL